MPSKNAVFIVSKVKKTNSVSVNNFIKFERMFTIFVGNIKK